jgi:hypothetical protein
MIFYGEPNQMVRKKCRKQMSREFEMKPAFRFNPNGELELPDDHPLIDRMKKRFRYEAVEAVPAEETFKMNCRKCDFKTNNHGELMAHHRLRHPKGASA